MERSRQGHIRQVADLRQPENRAPRGLRRLLNRITGNKRPLDPKPVVSSVDIQGDNERRQRCIGLENHVNTEGQKPTVDDHVGKKGGDDTSIQTWRGFAASLETANPDGRMIPAPEHKSITSCTDPTNNSLSSSTTQIAGHDTTMDHNDGQTPSRHWADDKQPDGMSTRDISIMPPSLWDRAYDSLQESQPDLLKEYESLLEAEITKSITELESNKKHTKTNEPGRVLQTELSRWGHLKRMIDRSLKTVENNTLKFTIFDHEFVPRDKVSQAANLAISIKDFIDQAFKASPEASMVWAGVCIVLPLLTNPIIAAEANKDGFAYVTSRMSFWSAVQPQILRPDIGPPISPAVKQVVENHFVLLYQLMLEFQIRTVLRCHYQSLRRYFEDVCSPGIWEELITAIKNEENMFSQDLQHIHNINTADSNLLRMDQSNESSMAIQRLIRDVAEDIHKLVGEKEKECLQLFRLTDSNKDVTYEWYKNRVEDRVENTCKWVLQHEHFQAWLDAESGPLLISADPGCGKSVMSKYLVDHFFPTTSSTSTATICYFFFKDGDQNSVRQALCAVLHQLFSQRKHLVKHAMVQYEDNGRGIINSTHSLWKVFVQAVQDKNAGPIIMLLDAMDECLETECQYLIRNIGSLFDTSGQPDSGQAQLRILLTSRPYYQIVDNFHAVNNWLPYLQIPGEESSDLISEEINQVVKFRVEQFARDQQLRLNVKETLQNQLLAIQHRTYLWVYLVFDYLEELNLKKTPKGVVEAMKQLPKNVNQAYERILSRSKDQEMARKALCIILAAYRPLTISEMNIAVNVDPTSASMEDLDEDDKDFEKRLRASCGLFISVHHEKVYFLHQTAREFLIFQGKTNNDNEISSSSSWKNSIDLPQAHRALLHSCVCHMKLTDGNDQLLRKTDEDPFWNYAAENWALHLENWGGFGGDGMLSSLVNGLLNRTVYTEKNFTEARHIPWFTWEDYGGFNSMLQVASFSGVEAVVCWLLSLQNLDIERERAGGRWPSIQLAAITGREKIAQALIKRFPHAVEEIGSRFLEPLVGIFCRQEPWPVVSLLLSHGLLTHAMGAGELGIRLLVRAILARSESCVMLLLDNGVQEIINTCTDGYTPLGHAILTHSTPIAALLLERGADIEIADEKGMPPLLLAVEQESEEMIQLLLKSGADINKQAADGRRGGALHMVIFRRDPKLNIIKLLLAEGADIDGCDYSQRTALHIAAARAYKSSDLVEFLLDWGAQIEATDEDGMTALHHAVEAGNVFTVQILLGSGAQLEVVDKKGHTPLQMATSLATKFSGPINRIPVGPHDHVLQVLKYFQTRLFGEEA